MTPSALALRAAGLGDLLVAVPALKALRCALPDHHLVLAGPAGLTPLVGDLVDDVLDVRAQDGPAGLLSMHGGPKHDVVVNLHGQGPDSHRALRTLVRDDGRLIAYRCPPVHDTGPAWRGDEHETERWCRLVSDGLGVTCDPDSLGLSGPEPSASKGGAVVHIGTSRRDKEWPSERWAEIVRSLSDEVGRVWLTGTVSERPEVLHVARQADVNRRQVLAGRTDVRALRDLVGSVRLVVCGDTGIAHLAAATGTPTVRLFGTPASTWEPRGGPHVVLRGDGMTRIDVDVVLEACRSALDVDGGRT